MSAPYAEAPPGAPEARGSTAVLVDDTPDIRQLLGLALHRAGITVVGEAGNGREGIRIAAHHQPDFVLIDLSMPEMDGLTALPELRRHCPGALLVVLSGFAADRVAADALAAGADAYVQKGTSMSELVRRLRKLQGDGSSPLPTISPERASGTPTRSTGALTAEPDMGGPVVDGAPFGILVVGPDPPWRLRSANAAARELLGRVDTGDEPLAAIAPALASLLQQGRSEDRLDLPGGRTRVTARRRPEHGVVVYLMPAPEDGDDLRRAMAASAHELRGPVSVIGGATEMLQLPLEELDATTRERLLASIARQAQLLESITADMLAAAQAERGTMHPQRQVVDPAEVAGIVLERYDATLEVCDARAVLADPDWLEQMINNLMSNAAKYGAEPFVLRILPDGDSVALEVRDHGDGVPEAFRDRLFHEFARAPGTTARGTGLGLYVVRSLARAQGGDVGYRDGDPGAVFTLRLPALNTQESVSGTR